MIGALSDLRSAHPQLFSRPIWDELPKGWFDLSTPRAEKLKNSSVRSPDAERLVVMEIKAKFGKLRFYYSLEDANALVLDIRSIVEAATLRSTTICQECGAPGERAVLGSWVASLCEIHAGRQAGAA